MPAEPPVDPPPDDDLVPPTFCPDCGLPIPEPQRQGEHSGVSSWIVPDPPVGGCECERVVEVRVLIRLEDTTP